MRKRGRDGRSAASPGRREKRVGGPGSRPHLSEKNVESDTKLLRVRSAAPRAKQIDQPPEGGRVEGKFALCCAVVAAARSRRGGDGCPLPSSLRGWAAARGAGRAPAPSLFPCLAACSPRWRARLPACLPCSLLLPASWRRWRGPWTGGHGNAARCGCRGALRSGSSWGSAGLSLDSGCGAEGTAPSCGALWGPAGVLRAGFGLRAGGHWLRCLCARRSAPRFRQALGDAGRREGAAVVGPGRQGWQVGARRGQGGEAPSGRRRDAAAARAAAWLSCSLARSRGPRPARRSPDTGKRRAQPHSPPEGGAALGPKEP